ncbi:MAG: hypothetical protein KIT14_15955 [bacterium]|nr:hypothetical protein [bacterium]
MQHHDEPTKEIDRSLPTDPTGTVFQPDLLLPSQMAGAAPPDDPCRRLVLAVLERALLDASGRSRDAERDEARAWIASDAESPFSFRWVTNQLGIDGDWLRSRARRLAPRIEKTTPAPAPEPQADGRNAA